MYNKINKKLINRAGGGLCLLLLCVCAAGIANAQDNVLTINDIEIRSGARGMILMITGTGPVSVDIPKAAAAKYSELRITVNNARLDASLAKSFKAPPELPIDNIAASEAKNNVHIAIKMRGPTNGPIDTRASNNQARILMTKDSQPEMKWSVKTADAVQQANIAPEPVDMKKAEERAAQTHDDSKVFTVSGQTRPAQAQTAPQVATRTEIPTIAETIPDEAVAGELVRYKVYGRDPFVPLVRDTALTELPRVENLRLVGVLEDTRERIALVEDFKNDNRAFALRVNDPVEYGKVLRVHRDKIVFIIRDFDVSRSYTLNLTNR